jgi:hypothetical protein
VGATSPIQRLTVTNSGAAPLSIAAIVTTGEFAESNNCPVSVGTLAVGRSCTVKVTFAPTTTGLRRGTVTITDSAPGSPHSVILSGIGR